MKLGSLFDGIGGFPLAGAKFGIEPIWASEIESFPVKVTQHHFPNMKHLGDITKINGAEIEPADIITFGSPCQDLSVMGKRAGLDGERSGLFLEAIRIIKEMRCATNGQFPRFAVWENVPGAFSSNGGQDFRAVLESFTNSTIPMPVSGGWADAGMVRTNSVDLAWRVLDAQYWGVPQRRRRIFLVADFGGQCAGEILFKPEGLRGYYQESREAREEAAGAVGSGVDESVYAIDHVITTGGNCTAQGPCVKEDGPMFTLKAAGSHAVAQCVTTGTGRRYDAETETLLPVQLYDMTHANEVMRSIAEGLAPTLNSRMGTGGNQVPVMLQSYAVRRLTPLECERLQGFPDGWTDIPGASDTARYKALGNSVAIPCVEYVLGGIAGLIE